MKLTNFYLFPQFLESGLIPAQQTIAQEDGPAPEVVPGFVPAAQGPGAGSGQTAPVAVGRAGRPVGDLHLLRQVSGLRRGV